MNDRCKPTKWPILSNKWITLFDPISESNESFISSHSFFIISNTYTYIYIYICTYSAALSFYALALVLDTFWYVGSFSFYYKKLREERERRMVGWLWLGFSTVVIGYTLDTCSEWSIL